MRLSKDILDKPIISVDEGRHLGKAKDLLVDKELTRMTGIFIRREGMFRRKTIYIPHERVVVFGIDAILIESSDAITDSRISPMGDWIELKTMFGRTIDTPGGTKVATLGDVVLNDEALITGFTLGKVYLSSPIAENGAIARAAVIDAGHEDGTMTINIDKAERFGFPEDSMPGTLADEGELSFSEDEPLDLTQPIESASVDVSETADETGGSQLDEQGAVFEADGDDGGANVTLDPPSGR